MASKRALDHLVPQMGGKVITNNKSKLNQLKYEYNNKYNRAVAVSEKEQSTYTGNKKAKFGNYPNNILIQGIDLANHPTNMLYLYSSFGDLSDENNEFTKKLKDLDHEKILYAVLIGDAVDITEIPDNLFADQEYLRYVSIGSNITRIGDQAFANCENLTTLSINNNNLEFLGDEVFKNNTSLTSTITIPATMTSVPTGLFNGASLPSEYQLGGNITQINSEAFANTINIKTLYIGENITTIASDAFANSSVDTIVINKGPGQVDGFSTKWGANENTEIRWTGELVINSEKIALFNVSTLNLTEYDTASDTNDALTEASEDSRYQMIFGDDWCVANPSVFQTLGQLSITTENRLKVSSIKIGEGVTSIGAGILAGFVNAEKIELPTTLETIQAGSFSGDTALTEIVFPDALTTISNGAFAGSLETIHTSPNKTITFGSGLTSIGQGAFGTLHIEDITIPGNIKTIGDGAFGCDLYLKTLVIEDGVETIGASAFYVMNASTYVGADDITDHSTISEINIPNSVESIGAEAFAYRKTISVINIGTGITSIGERAFSGIASDDHPLTININAHSTDNEFDTRMCSWFGVQTNEQIPDTVTVRFLLDD